MTELADAVLGLDDEPECRAVVLCSEGKNFCAGADLKRQRSPRRHHHPLRAGGAPLLQPQADRRRGAGCRGRRRPRARRWRPTSAWRRPRPASAATSPSSGSTRASASRSRCPRSSGQQHALELMYTAVDVRGEEALRIGLADRLVAADELRRAAHAFASEIASSAPLALLSIRETMRGDLADRVRARDRTREPGAAAPPRDRRLPRGRRRDRRAPAAELHGSLAVSGAPDRDRPRVVRALGRRPRSRTRRRRSPPRSSPAASRTSPRTCATPTAASSSCAARRCTACCPPRTTWAASTASSPRSARRPCPSPTRSRTATTPTSSARRST